MSLARFAAVAALGTFLSAATPSRLSDREKAEGWQLLFDGRSIAGWNNPDSKNPPGNAWTIEDGCLKAVPKPRITEDLVSAATYQDFDLTFEWRVSPGGNSGVKYRIQDLVFLGSGSFPRFEDQVQESALHRVPRAASGQEYVVGFEYQVIDNSAHGDARRGPKYQAGGLYDLVGPSRDVTRPPGQFNEGRIVLRGNRVEHWLNGVKVVDTDLAAAARGAAARWGAQSKVYDMLTRQERRSCPISLQNHGDAAWFRNIKIRRLD